MDRPPMTMRQLYALGFACLFMLFGVANLWDGNGMSALACAALALVAALLGRIP